MSEELWYVKLANGDVHKVTLDQLDTAFQAGHIDENTMVLAEGLDTWSKLGDVAGLGEEEAEAPASPAKAPAADPSHGFDLSRTYDAPAYVAPPAPSAYVPSQAQTLPMQNSPYAATRAAAAQAAPVQRYAAPVAMAPAPSPYVPTSLRPLSMDLEGDLDIPVRRKSRWGFVVAVVGLAGIAGGIGFAAQKMHFGQSSTDDIASVAAAAAVAPPPPAVQAPPPADPTPSPAAPSFVAPSSNASAATATAGGTTVSDNSPLNPQFTTQLNEKVKLSSAGKGRDAKSKGRHGGAPAASHGPAKVKSPFTTGGNKFDPLNSSI